MSTGLSRSCCVAHVSLRLHHKEMEKFFKTEPMERSGAGGAKVTATNGGKQLKGITRVEEKLSITRQALNSVFSS